MAEKMKSHESKDEKKTEEKREQTASDAVREGLQQVKISKEDAKNLERKLQTEVLESWHEAIESTKATKIPTKNIPAYLDHLQDAYEGIDEKQRKKMNGVLFGGDTWDHKIFDWKLEDKGYKANARYCMIAFGKSSDGNYVDCVYVLYKMELEIPKEIVVKERHSHLFGLLQWTTTSVRENKSMLEMKRNKEYKNFFRLKALQGFYNEGLMDRINYVPSLDKVDDD